MKTLFLLVKRILKLIYPKIEIVGKENLPNEPVIIVGNHSQVHGPIACELYFDEQYTTWCIGEMTTLKDVPKYAFQDFWSKKPIFSRWIYKILSYLIAPISAFLFKYARVIPVYKDNKVLTTFRKSCNALSEGKNLIIFPEHDVPFNNILYDFQKNFINLAKLYYKKTNKEVKFIPMYIAPRLKKIFLCKPIAFNHNEPFDEQKDKICNYLMEQITSIARNLPEHIVVPYRNIPKRLYPTNKQTEV